jgi:ketosteroid isomerase-like protein
MKRVPGSTLILAISLATCVLAPANRFILAQADSGATPPAAAKTDSLEQQVVAAERDGLDALKAGNVDRFADHTADDAVFVDAAGPATKAQVVSNVAGFRLAEYAMDDVKFVPLSPTSGLIVYTITEKGVSHGRQFAARAYISSIWTKRGGKWVCQFSQETAARRPAGEAH